MTEARIPRCVRLSSSLYLSIHSFLTSAYHASPRAALHPAARSSILLSPDWQTSDKLIVVIPKPGVLPGVWSRSVCVEEGLVAGSMIGFVHQAHLKGYGVVITNPSTNSVMVQDPVSAWGVDIRGGMGLLISLPLPAISLPISLSLSLPISQSPSPSIYLSLFIYLSPYISISIPLPLSIPISVSLLSPENHSTLSPCKPKRYPSWDQRLGKSTSSTCGTTLWPRQTQRQSASSRTGMASLCIATWCKSERLM